VSGYRRELDLDAAVARTRFSSAGVSYLREAFVSPVDQVIALRLSAQERGRIHCDITMASPQKSRVTLGEHDTLVLSGLTRSQWGVDGAVTFEVRVKVITRGGTVTSQKEGSAARTGANTARGASLSVRDADEVILLLAAATSYRRYDDITADPAAITAQQLAAAARKPFRRLLADHLAEHRRLFRRVHIDLGSTAAAQQPTDERVRDSAASDDPALAALYYQYGRYLLISSSRPGCQPANLQGIWNDSMDPPWESKWTININTEMNYWPAEPTNLGECMLPLVAMLRELSETGARTARTMYGAGGWVVHNNTDIWRAAAPVDGAQWGLWPTGGAWLCRHLWDHYDYGRDTAYLAEIYPILKGAAQFFLDTLVEEPAQGSLVTCPSLSPEHVHPHGASLCAGPAMDRQILRDLFANCIEAATLLGRDEALRDRLQQARQRLAPDRIGAAGQLQEWLEDWDMEAPEIHHRHLSHLYAVYPSSQITLGDTPQLAAAARKSLEIRGDEATGWGIGWRLNIWARLRDAERAHRVLKMLLRPERTYPNLFDAHPPFQIDGNFGGTAGITEMLMQSWGGAIHLLPALPAAWSRGSIRGLRARGACGIDITWAEGRLQEATLGSEKGGRYLVRYGTQEVHMELAAGSSARVGLEEGVLRVI
jgi:alpha-L-fucosidase 2